MVYKGFVNENHQRVSQFASPLAFGFEAKLVNIAHTSCNQTSSSFSLKEIVNVKNILSVEDYYFCDSRTLVSANVKLKVDLIEN